MAPNRLRTHADQRFKRTSVWAAAYWGRELSVLVYVVESIPGMGRTGNCLVAGNTFAEISLA